MADKDMPLGQRIVLKVLQAYVYVVNWFRPSRDDAK